MFLKMCGHHVCYFLLFVLILFNMNRSCLGTADIRSPSPEFHKHSIVRPILLHGRTKHEILTTEHTNGEHHPEIDVSLRIAGEQWVLELKLNEHLLADGHTLQYEHGGKIIKHFSQSEELNLCHYSGSVRGKAQSWAAMSTCRGLRGVIFDGRTTLYIEPAEGLNGLHYLYHHKDLIMDRFRGSGVQHDLEIASQRYEQGNKGRNQTRHKRTTPTMNSREPFHPDPKPRYLELVLVADKSTYEACGRDERVVQAKLIELVNIVNSMFTPLNIYITLVDVVVWSERDKIPITRDVNFTTWNFVHLDSVTTTPYDIAFLITNMPFDQDVVGRSHKNMLCRTEFPNSAGGVVVNHTAQIGLVASTFAHELGHSFGIEHDEECLVEYCPDEHCIMVSHTTGTMETHWSECSLKQLKASFEKKLDHCLQNKPKRFRNVLGPHCGNGITETGEQCDCGTTVYVGLTRCHACCDPDTCMLRQNATCAAGTCCDFNTCQPKSEGVVCRSAEGECDLPEYCSGDFEHCPRNVYKMDSTPCRVGKDKSYCVLGTCRSRHSQCQFLWGAKASSHEACYALKNPIGTKHGNCGYDHSTRTYKRCKEEDAPCGLLQCHNDGSANIALPITKYYDIREHKSKYERKDLKREYLCYSSGFNQFPHLFDHGRVPDGATCGSDKMCLNQTCVPLKSVRENISRYASSVCPSNCSGYGICNSKGHCHCDSGYAPPLCATKGQGGSVDSGPASAKPGVQSFDRPEQEIIRILMYVLYLGVIILNMLLLLLLCYYSRNGILWKQMKNAYYLCRTKCSCNEMTENRNIVENVPIINKDIDLITDNGYIVINPTPTLATEIEMPSIESESKEPIFDLVDDDNIRTGTNDTKSDPADLSYNDNTNCFQLALNNIKLKSVKPKNSTQHNDIKTIINNVKLKPVVQKLIDNQESKDCNDDNQINIMAIGFKKPKHLSPKTRKTLLTPVSNKKEGIFCIRAEKKNNHADMQFIIENSFLKPVENVNNNNETLVLGQEQIQTQIPNFHRRNPF